MTIEFGDGGATVPGSTIVVVKEAIRFTQNGKKVACVDAEYDTAGLPPELMNLFLQLVRQQAVNLVLPSGCSCWIEHEHQEPRPEHVKKSTVIPMSEERTKPWWAFW